MMAWQHPAWTYEFTCTITDISESRNSICHGNAIQMTRANKAPALVRFPVPVTSPNDKRYVLSHSCLVRSLNEFAN